MEINLKQLGNQAVEASVGTKKMRLSENATSMVFQLFTKNIYSNPIGTVVREITSNCFDSHVEAKVNAPVLIKKSVDEQTNTTYISFIDYGVGMSPDRVENIYGVYFESTKRDNNDQIGGFGIGGKTPLAYKRSTGHGSDEYDNSFYVITIHNKVKYYYCIFEGTESPVISLLHSEPTKEKNGTEVRIPVLEKDLSTFEKEMTRQLYYFENIIFDGFDNYNLSNEYQIVRGKSFLYRGTQYSGYVHVCLGRVAYPIDYNVLGLNSNDFSLPIALKLNVGDINVTASREQLDYNEATIKMLKTKLAETKAEIVQLLMKQYDDIVTLKDFFSVKHDFGILTFPNGMKINVKSVVSSKDVNFANFKYNFLKMPNDKQLFKFFFESRIIGKVKRSRYNSSSTIYEGSYEALLNKYTPLYYFEEGSALSRKMIKIAYLKSLHESYAVVNRRDLFGIGMRHDIFELFNVSLDALVDKNGKPVDYMEHLLAMQEEYFEIVRENAICEYNSIEIPESFEYRKKKDPLSKEVRNTSISIKLFGGYGKYKIRLDDLFNFQFPIFYGLQEDEDKLYIAQKLYSKLFNKNMLVCRYDEYNHKFLKENSKTNDKGGIMFAMVSKSNEKYIQYCKNAIHINQFYNKMLYRKENMVMEYFQTNLIVEKYYGLNDMYRDELFHKVDKKWGKVITGVNKYINSIPSNQMDLSDYKRELSKYFDLTNIKQTPEQLKMGNVIDSLYELQKKNQMVLKYINTPYNLSYADDKLFEILGVVMDL